MLGCNKKYKIYIKTLGCDKNTCDSEGLMGLLNLEGFEYVCEPESADVLLVNTCGFINDAKVQSIDSIFELAGMKEERLLVVTGCLSQRYGEELIKSIPEVDIFAGVNDYLRLPEIIAGALSGNNKKALVRSKADGVFKDAHARWRITETPWTAPIKISEGCRNICTYCAIPMIRGAYVERSFDSIINEAEELAKLGVKELMLVAQDVTAYSRLSDLLRRLCKISGIEWIRLLYCYEDEITDELLETIKAEPKICKYIDIPLQHYSSSVLKAMNRRSTQSSIKFTVNNLRKQIPGIVIRTTFITGFPGETKEDFEKLYNFAANTRFDRLGVFAYSNEEGTKASRMSNQVRKDVKERRRDKLMALQQGISLENNRKYIGKELKVLIEEDNGDGSYYGRTEYDAPDIDNGVIVFSDAALPPGSFVNVIIDDAFDYDLSGRAVL